MEEWISLASYTFEVWFHSPTFSYNSDFSNYHAVVMHKSAIGTVKRKDLVMETTYDPRRIGSLITGRMLMGSGILRPESAVSIKTA